jgi:hypothetical protein
MNKSSSINEIKKNIICAENLRKTTWITKVEMEG